LIVAAQERRARRRDDRRLPISRVDSVLRFARQRPVAEIGPHERQRMVPRCQSDMAIILDHLTAYVTRAQAAVDVENSRKVGIEFEIWHPRPECGEHEVQVYWCSLHRSCIVCRRRTRKLLETFGEMRLIGKPHIQRNLRRRHAKPQELSRLHNANLR